MQALSRNVEFVFISCCQCHVEFAITKNHEHRLKEKHETFYCPSGHPQYFTGKNEKERLQEKLKQQMEEATRQASNAIYYQKQAEAAEKEAKQAKAKLKKVEKRIHAGVCPCCNRTFQNLQRHMQNKHPEGAK